MKSFSLVPTSEGPRREFKITWGLRAGYGPSGRIYDLEEAIRAAHRWMRERNARAEPFFSGMPSAMARDQVRYAILTLVDRMSGLHWGNVGLEEEGTGWSASSLAIEKALR